MEVQVPSDKFASDQFTSEQGALDCLAVDTTQPTGAEDAVRHALATREDRERRRLEFRSSLMNARASVTPVERREMMQQPVQPRRIRKSHTHLLNHLKGASLFESHIFDCSAG